ncbi:Uncharacterized protein TCAP_04034 [Tolypocladium capitatum]|uniref:Uncharacterized protein n=1 Tax=Tolypocladium capitatum TaxID=45235 RepID=A0A2K3QEU1_9HYPO|nr:Uncharacterized protein TCAP_04034 [Tolypocladium capitatum]
MAGIWETAAFIIRTIGAHDQRQMQYAIWGLLLLLLLLLLLAPLWINAFAYMAVARMVHFALPEQKIWGIRAAKLTLIFTWLDVVCFLVQAAGGVLLALTLLNACHPGLVLRRPHSEFPRLSRAEKKAIRQQNEDDDDDKRRREHGEHVRRVTMGSESEWERHRRV